MSSAQKSAFVNIVLAICVLLIGVLVYLVDRQANSVYLIPSWMFIGNSGQPFLIIIGDHLPTFAHVYAFILLTSLLPIPTDKNIVVICLFWFSFDSLFENIPTYFQSATFDILELASIAVGTLAAYLTITTSSRRNYSHVYR